MALTDQDLWENFFGCGFEYDPVIMGYTDALEFVSGDWDTPGVVKLHLQDGDTGEDLGTFDLTASEIRRGLKIAIEKGAHHCGSAITEDVNDWDSCVGDAILQHAIWGDFIYS